MAGVAVVAAGELHRHGAQPPGQLDRAPPVEDGVRRGDSGRGDDPGPAAGHIELVVDDGAEVVPEEEVEVRLALGCHGLRGQVRLGVVAGDAEHARHLLERGGEPGPQVELTDLGQLGAVPGALGRGQQPG